MSLKKVTSSVLLSHVTLKNGWLSSLPVMWTSNPQHEVILMPSVKEFKEHPRNANTDWQRLGRTFNVSGFSPQTLNKTDCLIGNSYWRNTWSSCVENYSLNVYSKVPTASHLKMPCCAAIKYFIKDKKQAWWNGYTFYQHVKLLSCLENLMLSNKNAAVYQLSCLV